MVIVLFYEEKNIAMLNALCLTTIAMKILLLNN